MKRNYFVKQKSLISFVQFIHTDNFETLEAEIFQTFFFNMFSFCFHLPEVTFIKAFEAVFLWKTDLNFFKTIIRSIPVSFRFAYLLIYKMEVLREAMSWFILSVQGFCHRQNLWMQEECKPCPFLQKLQLIPTGWVKDIVHSIIHCFNCFMQHGY